MDWKHHLHRVGACDLVLDTFVYNAHTTASDLLWMAVSFSSVTHYVFTCHSLCIYLSLTMYPPVTHNVSICHSLSGGKFSRGKWLDIVYVSGDLLITKNSDNQYAVRTKLYQYWDPGADTGWVFVDGV